MLLILSFIIVIKSADLFVDSLVEIGESVGISQIILGVTASAIGTSLPEFGSAMIAVFSGNPDIGVGVVIGSNIWNIAGILGISSIAAGYIYVKQSELRRDGLMTLLTAVILLFFMLLLNEITRIVGIILIITYIIYLYILIRSQNSKTEENEVDIESDDNFESSENVEEVVNTGRSRNKNILISFIGLSDLIIGSRILVYSGVEIGVLSGVPQMIIGLFALAIGTSLPEFVVTLRSAMKKMHSLSIGTVLGSNIFNILIGIGIPSLFLTIPLDKLAVSFDAPVMILVTVLLILLSYRKSKISRIGGAVLLAVYITYTITRIYLSI